MAVYIVFFLAVGVSVGNYIRVCINNKPILWRSFYFILITSVIMVAFLFFIGANAFEVYNYEGKFVLAVYVFFNTYIFYLMYFFTITKE